MMRIGVTGGREFDDLAEIRTVLGQFDRRHAVLVHGAARGADRLCAQVWREMGGVDDPHPARWDELGRAAGPIRNQEMIDSGLDLLVVFPGGSGTGDMSRRAAKASVRRLIVMDR